MFRELSEPLSNPSRLPKVGPRLDSFSKTFKYNHKLCKQDVYENEINDSFLPILKHIGEFVKKRKIINYGATAFNFFLKGSKYKGNINVADYNVYTNTPGITIKLRDELSNKFPKLKFNIQEKNC